ncbi:hypothetical protein B0T25DRAFT_567979 [Lasiosphaeria hispida]|uniref:Uncharacterized protein n=1 Tax=Lasiosphaeria hispida TaxID=260671 RepID=A0AAJ0HHB9_9PEZI|nr:hypothetical protein B0T25DRAFT_567979 [Lasiosphaeria hispida]
MPYNQELEAVERVFDMRFNINSSKGVQEKLPAIKEAFISLASLANPREKFDHVVYVGFAQRESFQLCNEIIGNTGEDKEEYERAEELTLKSSPEMERVAALLFFHWSWPNAILRHFLAFADDYLSVKARNDERNKTHGITYQDEDWIWLDKFELALRDRHDELFAHDQRSDRYSDLVDGRRDGNGREVNVDFFDNFHSILGEVARGEATVTVAPLPGDVKMWRLLAHHVMKYPEYFAQWPGVHFAATGLGNQTMPGEYPFRRTWWLDGWRVPFQGDINPAASGEHYGMVDDEIRGDLGNGLREVFDAGDVWDSWVLCRLHHIAAVSEENADWHAKLAGSAAFERNWEVTEAGYLQRRPSSRAYKELLLKTERRDVDRFLALSRRFPVLLPWQTIEFADYEGYDLQPVDSGAASQLLDAMGLVAWDETGELWDLVSLKGVKRASLGGGNPMAHARHNVYVTDDLHRRTSYMKEMPGQSYPCDCAICFSSSSPRPRLVERADISDSEDSDEDEHLEMASQILHRHRGPDHRGGELVFARRILANTDLVQNLDRVLSDWSDAVLIWGRGFNKKGKLIDAKTIYVLETLTGIKARQLRKLGRPVEYGQSRRGMGLKVAESYFSGRLLVDYPPYPETHGSQREELQLAMGPRYHPQYSDFAHFIKGSDVAVDWQAFDLGPTDVNVWAGRQQGQSMNGPLSMQVTLVVYSGENWEQRFWDRFVHLYDDAQGERNTGVVPFLGLTTLPIQFLSGPRAVGSEVGIRPATEPHAVADTRRPALVFRRLRTLAAEADVFWSFEARILFSAGAAPSRYNTLGAGTWRATWYHICEYLFDIGKTVFALDRPHGNINHRNLLIDRRVRRSPRVATVTYDPPRSMPAVRVVLTAPEGEPTSDAALASYAAPEVATSGVSRAADVFAWARLGVHFLSPDVNDRAFFRDQEGHGRLVYLADVLDRLEACLDPHPAPRLAAGRRLLHLLADISLRRVPLDGRKPAPASRYDMPARYPRVANLLPPWMNNAPPGGAVPVRMYRVYGEADFGQRGVVDGGGDPDDDDSDDRGGDDSSSSSDSDSAKPTPGSAAARGVFSDGGSSSGDDSPGGCYHVGDCDCDSVTPPPSVASPAASDEEDDDEDGEDEDETVTEITVTFASMVAAGDAFEDTDDEASSDEAGD